MRDVLFVQGAGEGVHASWDCHLVGSLRGALGPGYDVRYPRMPDEGDPAATTWGPVLERHMAALGPGAVVVGHLVGGTMLLHVLAGSAPAGDLGAIVLIAAPFIGPGGWAIEEITPGAAAAARLPAGVPVFVYHGEDDSVVPVTHAARYAEVLPHARVRRLAGRDHQLGNDLAEVAHDILMLERVAGPA